MSIADLDRQTLGNLIRRFKIIKDEYLMWGVAGLDAAAWCGRDGA